MKLCLALTHDMHSDMQTLTQDTRSAAEIILKYLSKSLYLGNRK